MYVLCLLSKGPVLCTLNAIEAFQKCKKDIPVNIKVGIHYYIVFLAKIKQNIFVAV